MQADGKILVGGSFTTIGEQLRSYLGRLGADGTVDLSFNPGANSQVKCLAVQADGKILVGGVFTTLDGQARNRIGRLHADGMVDLSFNPGASSTIRCLAMQADGKILVGGDFITLGGQPRNSLGRLNADGTLDTSFDPGVNNGVSSLAVQADGKILVGGGFTTLGGRPLHYIGRLHADGTLDPNFKPGASGTVYSLAVQADGKIVVGGDFTTLGGQTRYCIGRLNADGTLDDSFNPGAVGTEYPAVISLAVQADGKIVVGGYFTTLAEQTRSYIGRLHADGTADPSFNPGVSHGVRGRVNSLAVQLDGKIVVGGFFTTLGGQPRSYLGRLNNTEPATQHLSHDGSTLTWLREGTSPEVWRTTFDYSLNDIEWISLGAGSRIQRGWQRTGAAMPLDAKIRARGYTVGGQYDGSGWFVESVTSMTGQPGIGFQPASCTNDLGTAATFGVGASGSLPLSYQWYKDGKGLVDGGMIFGSTTATLTLNNVLAGDAGGYSVVISNALGTVTSAVAVLTVLTMRGPVITIQPFSALRNPGDSATFNVTAAGTPPLSYQWWKDGFLLAGATSATLALTNLQGTDAGTYWVAVANAFGTVNSSIALLTVVMPLPQALDNTSLVWTTAGSVPWFGQTIVTSDGIGAAQSGTITDGKSSILQTTVSGPGTLVFWWRVSSQSGSDYLRFTGGGLATSLSGEVAWRPEVVHLPMGSSTLQWTYIKDTAENSGQDAGWVDQVTFIADSFTPGSAVVAWGAGLTAGGGWPNCGQSVPPCLISAAAIAAGQAHSLALNRDGTVVAWGDNYYGQTNVPQMTAVAIVAGGRHSLALQQDGTVVGWGENRYCQSTGQWGGTHCDSGIVTLGDGWSFAEPLTNVVAIAAGDRHSLALKGDGTVVGWGDDQYGQCSGGSAAPSFDVAIGGWTLTNIVAIAAGEDHSLALKGNGTVVAWGENSVGQCNVPPALTEVVAIAAGAYHSLAQTADGTVVAWGAYGVYDYDHDKIQRQGPATPPTGLSNVVAIAGGPLHSLALQRDGTVVAWGLNTDEQGTAWCQATVPLGLSGVTAVAAGGYHSLALQSLGSPVVITQPVRHRAYTGQTARFRVVATGACPLRYQWQQNGTNISQATDPVLVLTNVQLTQAGSYRVVVTNARGTVTSADAFLTVSESSPVILVQPLISRGVALGGTLRFQVLADGSWPLHYQWQFNSTDVAGATNWELVLSGVAYEQSGQYAVVVSNALGVVTSSNVALSVSQVASWGRFDQIDLPAGLTNVVAVAGGYTHSLALTTDGRVVGWGDYDSGQATVPSGLSNVAAVAGGYDYSLALTAEGGLVGWGRNSSGLANVLPGLSNVVAIAAGLYHCLALKADGSVVAWGFNGHGQTNVPPGLTHVVAIAAGYYHSMALRQDGTVVAWGRNNAYDTEGEEYWDAGQATVPPGLRDVVAIAAGRAHSLALKSDGTVVGWGVDEDGDPLPGASVPPGLSNIVEIAAGDAHALALREDGTVIAWGSNEYWYLVGRDDEGEGSWERRFSGQAAVPPGLVNVVAIAAGGAHSLAVVGDGPPVMKVQPFNRSAYTGSTIRFRTRASGARPLHWQWQFNGTNISGATNAALVLTDVQPADSGYYAVAVSNEFGSITSASGHLAVINGPPLITDNLTDRLAFVGEAVSIQLMTDGSRPFQYQWQFNGVDIAGATNPMLILDSVRFSQSGQYAARVRNAFGSTTSANAALAVVNVAAWGDNQFGQLNAPWDLTNVVAVTADHWGSLALKADKSVIGWGSFMNVPSSWTNVRAITPRLALRADGTVIGWGGDWAGGSGVPLGLSNMVAIASTDSHCLAARSDGTVVAWGRWQVGNDHVPVMVPPGLSNMVAVAAGFSHHLALKADGTVVAWDGGDNRYGEATVPPDVCDVVAIAAGHQASRALKSDGTVVAWGYTPFDEATVIASLSNVVAIAPDMALRRDGTVIAWGANWAGQTNVPPGLTNVIAIAQGEDHRLAVVGDGSPAISVHPFGQTVSGGNTVRFNVMAAGNPPLACQWQFNGTNLAGATNRTLTLVNAQVAHAGHYAVLVSNALGVVTSQIAQLSVLVPPSVVPLPASTTAMVSSNVTLTIDAIGTPPLRYQWRKNGVNIPGATNAWLTITNVQFTDGGSYSVVVANSVGVVTSDPTLLVVEVASQAPPEDDFVNRRTLAGTNGFASGTNLFATRELGEPDHGGKRGSNSVWYAWRAPAAGIATFRTVGSTFDTLLGVYTNDLSVDPLPSILNLVPVAEDEDRGGYLTSQLRFNAVEGTDYQVAIDGFAGGQGTFILSWELEPTVETLPVITAPPEGRVVLTGSTVSFSVSAAGSGLSYQWCFNGAALAEATGATLTRTNVQAADVGFYTVRVRNNLGRWVESLPAGLEIGSAVGPLSQDKLEDWFGPGAGGGGGKGRAGLAGFSPGGGFISVAMGTINYRLINNTNAVTQAGEPNLCGMIGRASKWLVLQPETNAVLVVDTTGSSLRTALAVYRNTSMFGLATNVVDCDVSSAADGVHSRVRFDAEGGCSYLVVVDSLEGEGLIGLNWVLGQPAVVVSAWTNAVVPKGASLTLAVTVSNAVPPAQCQWHLNGEYIPGATNTTLVLSNMQRSVVGLYSVVVVNAIEVVVESVAYVRLEPVCVTVAQSGFDNGDDQWRWGTESMGDGVPGSGWQAGHLAVRGWQVGEAWWWTAPADFGVNRASYGGWLEFDLQQSASGTNRPVVKLVWAGFALQFQCATNAGPSWTHFRVPLREGIGWQREDGQSAERWDLEMLLAGPVEVEISGSFEAADDEVGLDNVSLVAPAPDLVPAMQVGLAAGQTVLVLEWPVVAAEYRLETTVALDGSAWTTNLPLAEWVVTNQQNRVTVLLTNQGGFFRLRQQ